MPASRSAWIYILASRKNGVLYISVTADLRTRVAQHKTGVSEGFTKQYRVTMLVHLEEFHEVRNAIAREKTLKGWTWQKKIRLIESANLDWEDLAAGWFEGGLGPSLRSG